MQQQAEQQGGKFAEVGHDSCTHLVVDEDNVTSLPFEPHDRLYVVLQEVYIAIVKCFNWHHLI